MFRRFIYCLPILLVVVILAGCASPTPTPTVPPALPNSGPTVTASPAAVTAPGAATTCRLNSQGGAIQHVIYIQFDNVHFTRDNPNVPSDLEQMPHLLNFIKGNGALLANHHTPLIAHTATDILTALTGLYPDRMGVPVANSFRYFNPDGSTNPGVSFAYWTAPLYDPSNKPTDTKYNMLTADGRNAPAPWVAYTRAGCNVGAAGAANIVLENIGVDIPTVFGAGSPEAQEVASNSKLATSDFVGIAVHCAAGADLCAQAHGGRPDTLPDEPGGYTDYMALFGYKYAGPQISPNGALNDLLGQPIRADSGQPGFPGFDSLSPAVSLAYVAAMQEHGIPVTYAYISDAHDAHPAGGSYGPGQAGYVQQLKVYDDGFAKFFDRMTTDGITPDNTLFVFTSDEGDHLISAAPTPAGCDGVQTPCTYDRIGEINLNLPALFATQNITPAAFTLHADSAPTFYLTGNPARTDPAVRNFAQALGKLTATNPYTGKHESLANTIADPVEMKLLHMVTADAARTPTLTLFAKPDYYLATSAPKSCGTDAVCINPGAAWNHGDVSPEIYTTWVGMAGPGIKRLGENNTIWTDHTDIRPTMLALLGLKDDYRSDGRVLVEALEDTALAPALKANRDAFVQIAQLYKQINAPVAEPALVSLKAATAALLSEDGAYAQFDTRLSDVTTRRDALAAQLAAQLDGVAFNGQNLDAGQVKGLLDQGQVILNLFNSLPAR
ncbi:MAG: hypothetical protein WCF84_19565 [Anaerolineae bacterium]